MQIAKNERQLLFRNVKPGMFVCDDEGVWQVVETVLNQDRFTAVTYISGVEESGSSNVRVTVADDVQETLSDEAAAAVARFRDALASRFEQIADQPAVNLGQEWRAHELRSLAKQIRDFPWEG